MVDVSSDQIATPSKQIVDAETDDAKASPPAKVTRQDVCDEYATVLLPLVAVHLAEGRKSKCMVKDSVSFIARLSAALFDSARGCDAQSEFGVEDIVAVMLGPLLAPLGDQSATLQAETAVALSAVVLKANQPLGPVDHGEARTSPRP